MRQLLDHKALAAILALGCGIWGCGGGGGGGEEEVGEWVRESIASDNFNRKNESPWTLSGLWEFDKLPVSVNNGDYSFRNTWETKTDYSLNYNALDSKISPPQYNYNTDDQQNLGSATREPINLHGYRNVTLTFWCNYDIDDNDLSNALVDQRTVEIAWEGKQYKVLLRPSGSSDESVYGFSNVDVCSGPEGKWHLHTVDLERARESFQQSNWDGMNVSITFRFDTVDRINNTGMGWFIEDMEVSGEYFYD